MKMSMTTNEFKTQKIVVRMWMKIIAIFHRTSLRAEDFIQFMPSTDGYDSYIDRAGYGTDSSFE